MQAVMNAPKFITVEGGEGVGKTTQLRLIEARLRAEGVPLQVTREPGGTSLGEQLRHLLLQKEGLAPTPMAELLMVFAARAQHVNTVIAPALARGEWVLCDRFTDASFAYQGFGRGIPLESIQQLAELVHPQTNPDLTILLDVDPKIYPVMSNSGCNPDDIVRWYEGSGGVEEAMNDQVRQEIYAELSAYVRPSPPTRPLPLATTPASCSTTA